ncbi:tetratricopeptide repeat protein [Kribbella antibiotica]|uniref:Tetratricopeptide repeat protein n=1 Tax=Kribbella antibiotica TaxID=190195 RepID=A0A4V2YQ11_9ACTN|nr:tetratricopeptide repeat protein [Kribbella antibiotica]
MFQGETDGLLAADRQLDAAEAELAVARGKLLHGRFLDGPGQEDPRELELFRRALELYDALGDERGRAEALFWIGCFHQVVRDDAEPAQEALESSAALARQTGDQLILSYALRHLGIAAHRAGRADEAARLLGESTQLRRSLGFTAGVAANQVGLIHLAIDQGRHADAESLLAEATTLAASANASTITNQLTAARGRL